MSRAAGAYAEEMWSTSRPRGGRAKVSSRFAMDTSSPRLNEGVGIKLASAVATSWGLSAQRWSV
eukprot:CAMPEP_0175814082 /NCGR_PEP_ID=MMETSP0107_2-20121207/5231_1 /TAXON_ID=195067 ORGANISM="Goniomonas pacifica, Strain CCMP1869" /NCGR_SAMPLE_ID=MMETSP0107_2 /ASSEMBLY_ACC=CAM_ASM_000203 /LENGTH=63 /DNA_ID=CAMNT_0017126009 /DNA_START=322 /DNA_END=513 /DNA_ORIENTATION=+